MSDAEVRQLERAEGGEARLRELIARARRGERGKRLWAKVWHANALLYHAWQTQPGAGGWTIRSLCNRRHINLRSAAQEGQVSAAGRRGPLVQRGTGPIVDPYNKRHMCPRCEKKVNEGGDSLHALEAERLYLEYARSLDFQEFADYDGTVW